MLCLSSATEELLKSAAIGGEVYKNYITETLIKFEKAIESYPGSHNCDKVLSSLVKENLDNLREDANRFISDAMIQHISKITYGITRMSLTNFVGIANSIGLRSIQQTQEYLFHLKHGSNIKRYRSEEDLHCSKGDHLAGFILNPNKESEEGLVEVTKERIPDKKTLFAKRIKELAPWPPVNEKTNFKKDGDTHDYRYFSFTGNSLEEIIEYMGNDILTPNEVMFNINTICREKISSGNYKFNQIRLFDDNGFAKANEDGTPAFESAFQRRPGKKSKIEIALIDKIGETFRVCISVKFIAVYSRHDENDEFLEIETPLPYCNCPKDIVKKFCTEHMKEFIWEGGIDKLERKCENCQGFYTFKDFIPIEYKTINLIISDDELDESHSDGEIASSNKRDREEGEEEIIQKRAKN